MEQTGMVCRDVVFGFAGAQPAAMAHGYVLNRSPIRIFLCGTE
jgi:hypothetical protein